MKKIKKMKNIKKSKNEMIRIRQRRKIKRSKTDIKQILHKLKKSQILRKKPENHHLCATGPENRSNYEL